MEISNISSSQTSYSQQVKPTKPQEPTPPSEGNIQNRQEPEEPSAPTRPSASQTEKNGINYDAVHSFQVIIEDYEDVLTLDDEQLDELSSRLQSAGLLEPGALINMTA